MRAHIQLGRMFRAPMSLHDSWFIIAGLMAVSFVCHLHAVSPQWPIPALVVAALASAGLFLASLILHELAHALVAKWRGLKVRSITLFAFGGVAQMEHDAADAPTEFWMGIAAPAASLALSTICFAAATLLGWVPATPAPSPWLAILIWFGYINVSIAALNVIPGFPLDGGRVVRAAIWQLTGDGTRATRIAARISQLVGAGFIAYGLWRMTVGGEVHGLWVVILGWVLIDAARTGFTGPEWARAMRMVRVRDVMSRDNLTVDGAANLQQFLTQYAFRTGQRCFLVREDEHVTGLITPQDVRQVARERWLNTPVRAVMRRFSELRTVEPEASVSEAFATMKRERLTQLAVMSRGHVEGVLLRGQIWARLQPEPELTM